MPSIEAMYFPTSVLFVDDSRNFLLNFTLQLDEDIAFEVKYSPYEALDVIYARDQAILANKSSQNALSRYNHLTFDSKNANGAISEIGKEIYNPLRFSEISVVVVDYEMPGMNGLEFISKMENSRIKRILLTGQTDEAIAKKAIDQGFVDLYIQKQDRNVFDKVNNGIRQLQHEYFQDMSKLVNKIMGVSASTEPFALRNERFIQFFKSILLKYNIVEYYLNDDLGSFLLVSDDGKISIIQNCVESEVQKCVEEAKLHQIKRSTLQQLEQGKKLPFLNLNRDLAKLDWQHFDNELYATTKIHLDQDYFCTFIPPEIIAKQLDLGQIFSYRDFSS